MPNQISSVKSALCGALTVAVYTLVAGSLAQAAVIANLNPTIDLYIDPIETQSTDGESGDIYNTNTANDLRIDSGELLIGNNGGNRDYRAFLKFDISSLNIGNVVSATLRLDLQDLGNQDDYGNAELRRINLSDWNGATVTYAHGSAATSSYIDQFALAVNPPAGTYTIDVTSTLQGWADGSFSNFGFALKQQAEGFDGTARQFTSLAGIESLRPLLTITYSEPVVPAPEPGSLALLAMGLLGLTRFARRRTK